MTSLSWSYIEYIILVSFPDIIRIFNTSLPTPFCYATVVLRFAINTEILLYQNGIIISRFVYIFMVKNILAFHDEFWNRFFCIFIRLFSFLLELSIVCLPGRQPIYFYLCTGTDPDIPKRHFNKLFNIQGLCVLSVLVHSTIIFKIKLYQKRELGRIAVGYDLNRAQSRENEKNTLTDLTTSIFTALVFSMNFIFLWIANAIPGNYYNIYPYIYFEYFFRLCWPSLFSSLMMIMYICRHNDYREYLKKHFMLFYEACSQYFYRNDCLPNCETSELRNN